MGKKDAGLGFWTFAAVASLSSLYLNHQDMFDNKLIPEVKRMFGVVGKAAEHDPRKALLENKVGVAATVAGQNPPPRKKDIFDEHFRQPEFKPLPESITPVYVESDEDKERRKKLGLDTKDPGYCTSDPCTTN